MITNLLASIVVTLITNTTERVPTHEVPGPRPPGYETSAVYFCHQEPDANPDRKWIRITVKEVSTLKFEYEGKPHEAVIGEKVISDNEVELSLKVTNEWLANHTNNVLERTFVSSFGSNGLWLQTSTNGFYSMAGDMIEIPPSKIPITTLTNLTNSPK